MKTTSAVWNDQISALGSAATRRPATLARIASAAHEGNAGKATWTPNVIVVGDLIEVDVF
jgi:hypothetical protein